MLLSCSLCKYEARCDDHIWNDAPVGTYKIISAGCPHCQGKWPSPISWTYEDNKGSPLPLHQTHNQAMHQQRAYADAQLSLSGSVVQISIQGTTETTCHKCGGNMLTYVIFGSCIGGTACSKCEMIIARPSVSRA